MYCCLSFANYTPDWKSLDSRPLPPWYDDAKFGIFLHWGVFSVPSTVGVWFWYDWKTGNPDAIAFMKNNFKPDFTYQDFAPMFTAELFNADKWADLFRDAGAKYVVLTTKHHDGFTNWPSNYSSFGWNSMDVGPNRDLVGELSAAVKNTGLKFGTYHSMFEFYNPLYLEDKQNNWTTNRFVKFKTMPELYELVNNYHPDIIWSDGQWDAPTEYWDSLNFLAWLYNSSPVKDEVVVNDRWGPDTMCVHGGFLNCDDKFNPGKLMPRKWENARTITNVAWGYLREYDLNNTLTMEDILYQLVTTVSCGGNLLLNVGPTKDGIIMPIFEERLRSIGQWLNLNGEAIYKTQPWLFQNDTINGNVWYTMSKSDSSVYAIALKWPTQSILSLGAPDPHVETTTVQLLGYKYMLSWKDRQGGGLDIIIPPIPFNLMPCKWAWVFKLDGLINA